jgi:hypothetical protein
MTSKEIIAEAMTKRAEDLETIIASLESSYSDALRRLENVFSIGSDLRFSPRRQK